MKAEPSIPACSMFASRPISYHAIFEALRCTVPNFRQIRLEPVDLFLVVRFERANVPSGEPVRADAGLRFALRARPGLARSSFPLRQAGRVTDAIFPAASSAHAPPQAATPHAGAPRHGRSGWRSVGAAAVPASSSQDGGRLPGGGASFGSAARYSSFVPRGRRTTTPGRSRGSRINASSVTRSAMSRANRSASLPQAFSASFWLVAAT